MRRVGRSGRFGKRKFRLAAQRRGCTRAGELHTTGMLSLLRVRNLAVVEEAKLELEAGFTCVTGETGAGKSVLLGALALLAGERADKGLIRHGCEQLEVEAQLQLGEDCPLHEALEELGMPPCEEGALLLRRTVTQSRPSRVEVNGQLTTRANLQALGERWIEVHGPGEQQAFFRERRQLELLDAFAGNGERLRAYVAAYAKYRELRAHRERLATGEQLDADERAFLEGQLERIDSVDTSDEAIEQLEQAYTRLQSAQEIIARAATAAEALAGEGAATEQAAAALRALEELAPTEPSAGALRERLNSAILEMDDIAEALKDLAAACEFEEEAAHELEAQMSAWLDLKRKYGHTPTQVREKAQALRERLASQSDIEVKLAELDAAIASNEQSLRARAGELLKTREAAGERLGEEATQLLRRLGFKRARLRIEVTATAELDAQGGSRCSFLFAPGNVMQPLAKIASSGELARVLLALKTVLATVDATPVLLFDEVDANIGGETALAVGELLRGLGTKHQVFCITHQPQVAAYGNHHYVVSKDQETETPRVRIEGIHAAESSRLAELARMMGDRGSKAAREHAAELLAQAGR